MTDCAPLNALNRLTAEHPRVWEYADTLHNDLCDWDSRLCYINVSAAIACLSGGRTPTPEDYGQAALCAALATWRRNKLVYRFDIGIADELVASAEDIKIPVEILYQMPAPCIDEMVDGFLVFVEDDSQAKEKELRIIYLQKNGQILLQSFIHLVPNGTIYDGLQKAKKVIRKNMEQEDAITSLKAERTIRQVDEFYQYACEAVQLILYICAENADMIEDEQQVKIFRPSNRILDKYREIRKYNVGVKAGELLRQSEVKKHSRSGADNEETSIREIRTHIRRSHWHHYWVGSKKERQLVLRWLPATIVNPDKDDLPVTIIDNQKT